MVANKLERGKIFVLLIKSEFWQLINMAVN